MNKHCVPRQQYFTYNGDIATSNTINKKYVYRKTSNINKYIYIVTKFKNY